MKNQKESYLMMRAVRSLALSFLIVISVAILSACTIAGGSNAAIGSSAEGQAAFVDEVTIKEHMGHSYASVRGHYPDACTRVSDSQQSIEGEAITILLFVDRPSDMMCAQMLTLFEVDILLETGGLAPGKYTVTVNDAAPATVTIEG